MDLWSPPDRVPQVVVKMLPDNFSLHHTSPASVLTSFQELCHTTLLRGLIHGIREHNKWFCVVTGIGQLVTWPKMPGLLPFTEDAGSSI